MTLEAPGSVFLAENREQPDCAPALLEHREEYEEIARQAAARRPRRRPPRRPRIIGQRRVLGVYAFGLQAAWTALRDSISLSVYYGAQLDLQRSIMHRPVAVGPDARRRHVRQLGRESWAPSQSP